MILTLENCTPYGQHFWQQLVGRQSEEVLTQFDFGHAYLLGTGSSCVAVQCLDNGKPPKEECRIALVAPSPSPNQWTMLATVQLTKRGFALFDLDGIPWPETFRIRIASLGYHFQDVPGHMGLQVINLIPDPYYSE